MRAGLMGWVQLVVPYLLLGWLSLAITPQASEAALLWLPNAWAVSCLLGVPPRRWPLLMLGAALANTAVNAPFTPAWSLAWQFVPLTLVEVLGAAGLLRWSGVQAERVRAGQLLTPGGLARLLPACCLPQLASASVGAATLVHLGQGEFRSHWVALYAGCGLGMLSMLGLALQLRFGSRAALRKAFLDDLRWLALAPLALGVVLLSMALIDTPFIFVALPLLLAAGLLQVSAVMALVLVVSMLLSWSIGSGLYALPPRSGELALLVTYAAYAAALVPALVLATVMQTLRDRSRHLRLALGDLGRRSAVGTPFAMDLVQLLRDEAGGSLPPRLAMHLDAVERYARWQRKLRRNDPHPLHTVDLEAERAWLEEQLAERLRDRRTTLKGDPMPRVLGDAELLRELLLQLTRNALDFPQPGRPLQLRIEVGEEDGMASITVADNGSGLSAEQLAQLGQPFLRAHAQSSTGLGAALALQIAEALGGRLSWVSTPGVGTRAQLLLPRPV